MAGIQILLAGGNAVAVGSTLNVVEPFTSGADPRRDGGALAI